MTTRLFSNPRPHFTLDDGVTSNTNGRLYFYEPGIGSTTLKYVYSKSPFTTANRLTNPVYLDGNGFAPTIRLDGDYRVKLTDKNGVTIWDVPNYQEAEPEGQYTEWSASLTYGVNDIVRYSDGNYYQSITSNNTGNTPSSSSNFWVKIFFITLWNTNKSYAVGEYAERSGEIYRSLTAHSGADPLTSRTNWERATAGNYDDWDSSYTYETNDTVRGSDGLFYRAYSASTGDDPVDGGAWVRQQIIEQWTFGTEYAEGRIVTYSSDLYISLTNGNVNNTPVVSTNDWKIITPTDHPTVFTKGATSTVASTGQTFSELFELDLDQGLYLLKFRISAQGTSGSGNFFLQITNNLTAPTWYPSEAFLDDMVAETPNVDFVLVSGGSGANLQLTPSTTTNTHYIRWEVMVAIPSGGRTLTVSGGSANISTNINWLTQSGYLIVTKL